MTRLLLLGMMGSGKTTVGRAIAARQGWAYVDNDELVHRATGRTTPEVKDEGGEDAMRDAESSALRHAASLPAPVVAGVAAGTVTREADREVLLREDVTVVWLRARMETLAARVGDGAGRAWLRPDPLAALTRLYEGREERYEEVADVVVDVDDVAPEQVVDQVLRAVGA